MGRRANLPDHGPKVHGIRECFSKDEADAMWRKYGFNRVGFDFHGALNQTVSWLDTYLDLEETPAKESIKILEAIHTAATSLRAYLDKPGADKLLCVHHEAAAADPSMSVRYTTDTRVLFSLEARCKVWPAPAKRLRQDILKASERLRDALSKSGFEELLKLYLYGAFPKPASIPTALDWLIPASAEAAKQIKDRTRQHQPDEMPRGKRKPRRTAHLWLLVRLRDLFRSANPGQDDTIQWVPTNKQYAGTFYEFAREIFPKAGIRVSGGRLGNLVKGVEEAHQAVLLAEKERKMAEEAARLEAERADADK